MPADLQRLRPSELCRLLNSTPLGEVIGERDLYRHRTSAGWRIGDGRRVDLLRYTAWLIRQRHAAKAASTEDALKGIDLADAAAGAAAIASQRDRSRGHGQKRSRKQEAAIAALLSEPTYAAAAIRAGVSKATLCRWMNDPNFTATYQQARRELVDTAVGRLQAGASQAAETLLAVARNGRRDGDRVRASIALLDQARRGLADAELLHGNPDEQRRSLDTADVVRLLASRLQQIDQSDLLAAEKARLTVAIANALSKAIQVNELAQRLDAIYDVLVKRTEMQEP